MRTRGRNYRRYVLSPQEMAKRYGPPLAGREKVVAEMKAINEERIFSTFHGEAHGEEWELETTPNRTELIVS